MMLEYEKECPKCGEPIRVADDSYMGFYSEFCDKCGYENDENYYYFPSDDTYHKVKKEDALARGLLFPCPDCGEPVERHEFKKYGRCAFCQNDKNLPL